MRKFTTVICLLITLFSFSSCNKGLDIQKASIEVDNLMNKSADAFTILEKAFENKKIVLLGSSDFTIINSHNFMNRSNVEKLRKMGVKYILLEGGRGDIIYSDEVLSEDWIVPFYPWHSVSVQYDNNDIKKVVLDVNKNLKEEDKIVLVGMEAKRKNISSMDNKEIYNYRDSNMFAVAEHFIDSSKEDEKILIITGSNHGVKKEVRVGGTFGFKWKPLGAYLNEKYADDYACFNYYTLSGNFEPWFINGSNLPGPQIKQKFFDKESALQLQKSIHFMQNKWETEVDGFFIDKNAEYGLKYTYKMNDPKVREAIINLAKESDKYLRSLHGVYDYSNPYTFYSVCDFLRSIYAIKLYYGEAFNYNFWNANNNFEKVINNLNFDAPPQYSITDQELSEYQLYISCLMNRLSSLTSKNQAKKYYEQNKGIIEKAINLLPEDIWADYWLSQINYKMGEYEQALKYADHFINNKVSLCSQVFPDMLYLALDCCEKLKEDAGFYIRMLARTNNQYNVEIEYFSLFDL